MYVLPFSMGPPSSPLSKLGVQLTDSAYVAASMRIMTRMGSSVLPLLGDDFIVGLTSPWGEKRYVAAAFPSACGKTNLAMLRPALPGWSVHCVGDDIAWMKFDDDGRLRAINPERGFFGVAPGTSSRTNPNAMAAIARNTIFTNVGLRSDGGVYWDGLDEPTPPGVTYTSWLGKPWKHGQGLGGTGRGLG
ncbi:UNVERIFIED_CONTAM: hypothetical protein H355_009908 [Colinus virginianus]|nr:hypothetical protein H355_009908 [Colinus virginianus]